jgi:hypothetical protein
MLQWKARLTVLLTTLSVITVAIGGAFAGAFGFDHLGW